MKNLVWMFSAVSAVAAYVIARQQARNVAAQPVAELAHKLEVAWADHHTIA
ncbi:hypothetical protein SAMN05421770_104101 [Granulicella rosea]|uniref:Uncharacterized protein n=1 Tax=Granulicella rosea TaxID=474952 RepID=A0A239JTB1_9BACT|nr:hypothetical protein [Granulicella rosea]SNT08688.1 hypothetical protein SAMN05421770_104101 [Granulicella rosea]